MTFQWWHIGVAVLPTLPNLWSIWHSWCHDFNGDMPKKSLWLVLTVFLPVLGGLIYIFAGRKYAGRILPKAAR